MSSEKWKLWERASWVDFPDKNGYRQLWRDRHLVRNFLDRDSLMDWAYFWLNWAPIFDTDGHCVCAESRGEITVCNPGVWKVSNFLVPIFQWKLLVLLDSKWNIDSEISIVEAENEGFIREVSYAEAWDYVGAQSRELNPVQAQLIQRGTVPAEVYQVLTSWADKLRITERVVQRPSILYFLGLRPRM